MRPCEMLSRGSLPLRFVNHVVLKSNHLGACGPSELKVLSNGTVQERSTKSMGHQWHGFAVQFKQSKVLWRGVSMKTLLVWRSKAPLCQNIVLRVSIWSVQMSFQKWVLKGLLILMTSSSVAKGFGPFKTYHLNWSNAHIFTRIGLWLPISLDSCPYCEDVIKLIYDVLTRPKIRPKHAPTPN